MRLPAAALDLMRGTCAAALLVTGCTRDAATQPLPIEPVPAAQLAPVAPPEPLPPTTVAPPAIVLPPPPPLIVATTDEPDAGDPAAALRAQQRRRERLQHQRIMARCGRG